MELETVTEIRRSNTSDRFMAGSVYVVLNSLWDWEPLERLEQRNIFSCTCDFSGWGKQFNAVLNATKAMDSCRRSTSKGRAMISVHQIVKLFHCDKHVDCSLSLSLSLYVSPLSLYVSRCQSVIQSVCLSLDLMLTSHSLHCHTFVSWRHSFSRTDGQATALAEPPHAFIGYTPGLFRKSDNLQLRDREDKKKEK